MTGDLRDQLGGEMTLQGHCVQPPVTWSSALAPLHPVSLHLEEGQELERGTGPVKEQGSSVLSLPSSFLLTPSPGLGHAAGAGLISRSGLWSWPGCSRSLPRGPAGALLSLTGYLGVCPRAPTLSSHHRRGSGLRLSVLHSRPATHTHLLGTLVCAPSLGDSERA